MKQHKFLSNVGRILGLVVIFSLVNTGSYQQWRAISDQYIDTFKPMEHFVLHASAQASHPEKFTPGMSYKTFSDSHIFQTDRDFHLNDGIGVSPLPYPPVAVYCVVGEFFFDDQTEFYFIALHTDGQHTDWVVHTPTGFWKGIRKLMDRIGCDIKRY